MATLHLKQGDTIERTVTITDSAGSVVDITGGTVKFRIVRNINDPTASAIYSNTSLTLSDPTNGEATLSITHAVSILWTAGNYFWEVEYVDSSSNYSHTDYGACIIDKSIYANG